MENETHFLVCLSCETRFEAGVADPTRDGAERCPQCGLSETRPLEEHERFGCVITKDTKFR
jgi:hypothetical protein